MKLIQQDLLAEHRHLLQNVEERGFLLEELFANAERASLVLERNEDMMRIAKIIEDNVYLKAEITLGLWRRRGRKDSGSPQPSNATNGIMHHYGRSTHLSPSALSLEHPVDPHIRPTRTHPASCRGEIIPTKTLFRKPHHTHSQVPSTHKNFQVSTRFSPS